MSRLSATPKNQVPPECQSQYANVTKDGSELANTFKALFCNLEVASKLANLDEIIAQGDLEIWIKFTVALAVCHECNNQVVWRSMERQARKSGVSDAVINGIAAGSEARGLLPKEGIWVQFTLEVIRNQMRDSTWRAVTHLIGDAGAISVAMAACYYEMMCRLNSSFGLDAA
mgnify:CR=1 FL=1